MSWHEACSINKSLTPPSSNKSSTAVYQDFLKFWTLFHKHPMKNVLLHSKERVPIPEAHRGMQIRQVFSWLGSMPRQQAYLAPQSWLWKDTLLSMAKTQHPGATAESGRTSKLWTSKENKIIKLGSWPTAWLATDLIYICTKLGVACSVPWK